MNNLFKILFQVLIIISLPLYASSLVTFQPDTPIKASEVNDNFNYIKSILQGKNIHINFKSFQQGNLILVNDFEDEFDKLRSIDIPVSPLNLLTIKSSELNQAFSEIKNGAELANDIPSTSNFSFSINEDSQYLGTVTFGNQTGNSNLEIVSPPSKGTIVVGVGGNFSYSPFLNNNGTDSFTFRINDGGNLSNISTALILINEINDIPVAVAQVLSTNEDISLNITLNGSDIESSSLTYEILTAPINGVISGTIPNITYTPNPNYFGSDSLTFRVSDGVNWSTPTSISLTINAVNDFPVVNLLSFSTPVNSPYSGTVSGSDIELSTLSYSVFVSPTKGSVNLNSSTGGFTYTPTTNQFGSDTFQVRASDGVDFSLPVTINVTLSTSQSCIANGGTGTQTFNTTTLAWNSCLITSCSGGKIPSTDQLDCVFVNATGGSVAIQGNYKVHTFTTTGTSSFNVASVAAGQNIEYLLIAGGGGGNPGSTAARGGGGGGAGGYLYGTTAISAQNFPIVVGAGGSGTSPATKGGNTTFNLLIAYGGGKGGGAYQSSSVAPDSLGEMNGGSSGGGGGANDTINFGRPGTPVAGQGNSGGNGGGTPSNSTGGGGGAGGGATSVGGANGGAGGNGITFSISGTAVTYSRGGNGGNATNQATGASGAANTGNGGGGGGGIAGTGTPSSGIGGNGGSGIVIIKYLYK